MTSQISLFVIATVFSLGFAITSSAAVISPAAVSGHNGGNWDSGADQLGHLSDVVAALNPILGTTVAGNTGMNTSVDPNDPSTWLYGGGSWHQEWKADDPLNHALTANSKIAWITLDLGGVEAGLETLFLWNVRHQSNTENVNTYNVYYSSGVGIDALPAAPKSKQWAGGSAAAADYDFSSGDWTKLNGSVLTLAQNTLNNNGPQAALALGGISAKYIGIEILTAGAGDQSPGRIGLAQIEVTKNVVSMDVVSSSPSDGQTMSSTPTTATFDFSLDVTPGSVQATDLLIDGSATATGVTIVDSDTVSFDLPAGLAAGSHTLEFPASSLTGGVALTPLNQFSASFTLVTPPTINNLASSGVASDAAIIGADLVASGGNLPDVLIYWGDNDGGTSAGSWDNVINLGPSIIGSYPQQLTGLTSETQYYYRSLATNSAGNTWAALTASFTTLETPPTMPPSIINLSPTNLGANSARLRGQVTDTGGETPSVTLYYGDDDAGSGTWDNFAVVGLQSGTFNQVVGGLLPMTTYYYRFSATNSAGTVAATPSLSFMTPAVTPVSIVINEVHYDPDTKTELVEFIELYNAGIDLVDLSGWTIDEAVDYTIPGGTSLASGEYLVIAQNPDHLTTKFSKASIGPYVGRLSTDGETIVLRNDQGQTQDSVDFQLGFPWPTVGDAPGNSIELINPTLSNSKGGNWRSSNGSPTPGAVNSTLAPNAAPVMRQVDHRPASPISGEAVTITIKVTDPDGVAQVYLSYQDVDPGDYIEIGDPRYATHWTNLAMFDDGTNGDAISGDDIYTAVLPTSLQQHRHLIRYKITSQDSLGASITGPYADDPTPNFAYFVYDGIPDWVSTQPKTYTGAQLGKPAVYQLITTREDHEDAMFIPNTSLTSGYTGSDYLWQGAFVYDGKVYDHINYRTRGGVHRFRWNKRMWKFDFNRGNYLQARDDYGKKYKKKWDKVNFSSLANGWGHPGQQGLFEQVGFKLYNLSGNFAPHTNMSHFRIVESVDENSNQVGSGPNNTDFQGLYLVIEQPDGRLLDEHDQPDGNLYKMEGGTGELNNQGPTQADDKSDLNAFLQYKSGNKTAQWWKDNFDLDDYYNFRAITTAIRHYDIGAGKNYFFYNNPETGKWQPMSWDLDITWQNPTNTSQGGPFSSHVLAIPEFAQDYRNRMREIRDLMFNSEQVGIMLDETANFIDTPGVNSIAEADGVKWRGNGTNAGTFPGKVAYMNQYVIDRNAMIDTSVLTDSSSVPYQPTLSYTGSGTYPVNGLDFSTGAFSSPTSENFAAMQWRIAEITDTSAPGFDPDVPRKYEINADWQSEELTTFANTITIPGDQLDVGDVYRVRVRMKDTAGLWSHWSDAHEFTAGTAVGPQIVGLRISEVMYNPADPTAAEAAAGFVDNDDFEFIVLRNIGISPLDLTGAAFTNGIDYTLPGITLAPGQELIVPRNAAAFAQRYDTTGLTMAPEYRNPIDGSNKLKNSDETIELMGVSGGIIHDFRYFDTWHPTTDGGGYSLVIIDDNVLRESWGTAVAWQASSQIGGTISSVSMWLVGHGLDPGSNLQQDLNGDGVALLMAYALDLNPNFNLSGSLPASVLGVDAISISFYGARPGIAYTVETSSDLQGWTTDGVTLSEPDLNGIRSASVDQTSPARFLRLGISN